MSGPNIYEASGLEHPMENSHNLLALMFALLAGIAYALFGLSYRVVITKGCRNTATLFSLSIFAGCISASRIPFEPLLLMDKGLLALAIFSGILQFTATTAMIHANTLGPNSIAWTVVNLSLLVPITVSPLLFHESVYLSDVCALILFICMVLFFRQGISRAGEVAGGRGWVLAMVLSCVFACNGLWLVLSKVKESVFPNSFAGEYATINYLTMAALSLAFHVKRSGWSALRAMELKVGAAAGALSATGMLCTLASLSLPSIVIFPVVNGISLTGGVVMTAILFRERMNYYKVLGICFGVIALLEITLREQFPHWMHVVLVK